MSLLVWIAASMSAERAAMMSFSCREGAASSNTGGGGACTCAVLGLGMGEGFEDGGGGWYMPSGPTTWRLLVDDLDTGSACAGPCLCTGLGCVGVADISNIDVWYWCCGL